MENKYKNSQEIFADWMEGKISDEELKKLLPEAEYMEFLKLRKALDIEAGLEKPLDGLYEKIENKMNLDTGSIHAGRKRKTYKLYDSRMGVAALIILFVAIGIILFNKPSEYKIISGQSIVKYVLPDGSQVVLAPESVLKYAGKDWEKNREVFLEGEAFFIVTKGNNFRVKTPNGTVKVLGTEFDVKARDSLFNVICYERKVLVESENLKTVLTPGEGIVKNGNQIKEIKVREKAPEWIRQESLFENEELSKVLEKMEEIYQIRFDTGGIDLHRRFTGAFPHDNLQLALASVFKALGISYKIDGKTVILKDKNE